MFSALEENPRSVSWIHVEWITGTCNPSSRRSKPHLAPPWPSWHAQHTHACTYIHKQQKTNLIGKIQNRGNYYSNIFNLTQYIQSVFNGIKCHEIAPFPPVVLSSGSVNGSDLQQLSTDCLVFIIGRPGAATFHCVDLRTQQVRSDPSNQPRISQNEAEGLNKWARAELREIFMGSQEQPLPS